MASLLTIRSVLLINKSSTAYSILVRLIVVSLLISNRRGSTSIHAFELCARIRSSILFSMGACASKAEGRLEGGRIDIHLSEAVSLFVLLFR
ncbi:hypothetical protein D3C85_1375890 [compost metagenome]